MNGRRINKVKIYSSNFGLYDLWIEKCLTVLHKRTRELYMQIVSEVHTQAEFSFVQFQHHNIL
jgi:hypothetical protein